MNIFFPGKYFLVYFLFLFIFSCSGKPKGEDSSSLKTDTNTLVADSVFIPDNPDTISTVISDSVTDESVKFPMLVIENCGVLWKADCANDSSLSRSKLKKEINAYFGAEEIISIGVNGVQNQKILEPYCMQGECGQNQVAFQLSKNECSGVLVPKSFLTNDHNVYTLNRIRSKEILDKSIQIKTDTSELDYIILSDIKQKYIIKIVGQGYVQENEWPMYTTIKWKFVGNTFSNELNEKWNPMHVQSTNLPIPISVIQTESDIILIWYHAVGICCPSSSETWYTRISRMNNGKLKMTDSKIFEGGFGQPCD